VFAFSYQDRTYTTLHAYLFGDDAPAIAAREEPLWRAWMDEHFPAATAG
jgi:hypothetical protein